MESGRNSLMTESDATAPSGSKHARASQALLGRLLAMAHRYRSDGNIRQATELYWSLVEDYPGTPQAHAARAVLLELATSYERNEARRMARSMYERLMGMES